MGWVETMRLKEVKEVLKFKNENEEVHKLLNFENAEIACGSCIWSGLAEILIIPLLKVVYVQKTPEQLHMHKVISLVYIMFTAGFYLYFNHYTKQDKEKRNSHILHIMIGLFNFVLAIYAILLSIGFFKETYAFVALMPILYWIYCVFIVEPKWSISTSIVSFLLIYTFDASIGEISSYYVTLMSYTWLFLLGSTLLRYFDALASARSYLQFEALNKNLQTDNTNLQMKTRYDGLTGTLNREGLRQDFESYVGKELSVMFCDIDDFKMLNDEYGHSTGDQALKQFANILLSRFNKDNVYRYGGDEFLIITDEPLDVFEMSVLKVQNDLVLNKIYGVDEMLTASLGFVHGECHSVDDLRLMLAHSDEHLYDAKSLGKNRCIGFFYHPCLEQEEMIHMPVLEEGCALVKTEILDKQAFLDRCIILEETDLSKHKKITFTMIRVDELSKDLVLKEKIEQLMLGTFFLNPIMIEEDTFVVYATYSTTKSKVMHIHELLKEESFGNKKMKAVILLPNVNNPIAETVADLYQRVNQLDEDQWYAEILEERA